MLSYILRRLLVLIPTILGVTLADLFAHPSHTRRSRGSDDG